MRNGKILVVDDDPVVSLSCKRILGAEGFATTTTAKGQDVLEMLDREDFDLLISDIRLPDISGLTVLKEAKAAHPETDVVMITGYPTLEDAKESIRLGAADYLEKPFTPDSMINVAKKVFDKREWSLKKEFVEQFKDHIAPIRDNNIVYHKEGVWTRASEDGLLELGCDVRYCMLGGDLVYIDFIKGLEVIKSGEPFARLLTSTGKISELPSPVTVHIREINASANEVLVVLSKNYLSEGWLLRLAKASPIGLD
jgi:CheY-like chemotaxis protein